MMPALLIKMSMGRPSALSSSPSALTLASDDKSRLLIVSLAVGTVARICLTADSPLARLRMAMMTSAPAADSRVVKPRPRPELEPVTTASFPERSGTVTVSLLEAMGFSLRLRDSAVLIPLPQEVLAHLTGACAREIRHQNPVVGLLIRAELFCGETFQFGNIDDGVGRREHGGDDGLTQAGVRDAEHRHLGHRVVSGDSLFDLCGIDV